MITILQSLSGTYFSANVPDLVFSIGGYRTAVTMTVDGSQIYSEHLYPVDGKITLAELDTLLTPYARQRLKIALQVGISELSEGSDTPVSTASLSADIIYSAACSRTTTSPRRAPSRPTPAYSPSRWPTGPTSCSARSASTWSISLAASRNQ